MTPKRSVDGAPRPVADAPIGSADPELSELAQVLAQQRVDVAEPVPAHDLEILARLARDRPQERLLTPPTRMRTSTRGM
jgi:hypothetical protein